GAVNIPVGTRMSKAKMIESGFINNTSCSFGGNTITGILAVYLSPEHADNDVTHVMDIKESYVDAGGLYGRMLVNGEWIQMYSQPRGRNAGFWTNIQFKIPIHLAVS